MYTIAIVGRANVGKTTIFNRLIGKQIAIVSDYAGVTRDRNEVRCSYYDIGDVVFVDTAGIEYQSKQSIIEKQMFCQAKKSIELADLCLFVIDGKIGVTEKDVDVFNILRKNNKTTILIVNKAENPQHINIDELNQFNIVSDKILLSAEHNLGFGDLYNAVEILYKNWLNDNKDYNCRVSDKRCCKDSDPDEIRIAVLGRPNVGKSTFLNNLLNEDRLITSDIAGTTRDKIELNFVYNNHNFVLIDTAGIRKRHKSGDILELASVEKSFEALRFADVAIVLMDITVALETQDLCVCQKVCSEGRILIVCFNKWDLVPKMKEQELLEKLKNTISKSVAQVKGIYFFTCSALYDKNLNILLDSVCDLYDKWKTKISASCINRKIEEAKRSVNVVSELKIHYINQIKTRPPTFVAFSGKNKKYITAQKAESIKNWLYREFCLFGIPIRISVRGKKEEKK